MTDTNQGSHDSTAPLAATPGPATGSTYTTGEAARPGVLERVWSLRTMAAVAISAVALSGAGGAALAAASDGGAGSRGPFGRGGFGPGQGQMQGRFPGQLHQGQVQQGQPGSGT